MTTSSKPPHYRAYLMRCWAEGVQATHKPLSWRFSLEDVHTGQRKGFPDLAALVTYLQMEFQSQDIDGPEDTLRE